MFRLFRSLLGRPSVERADAATALGERAWPYVREAFAWAVTVVSGAGVAWWSALQVAAPFAVATGVVVEGVRYGPIEAVLEARAYANSWLSVSLKEGRNREVRKVMAHLGLQVTRLIRVAYGPFQLGNLDRGAVDEVNGKVLREQVPDLPRPARPKS